MKAFSMSVFLGLLGAAGSVAAASSWIPDFPLKTLPVLVKVDASGKITNALPAVKLTPQLRRLLNRNLDEMITAPAKVHGQAVPSQFVINLRLNATPKDTGGYDVQFDYVSTAPVPHGSWHWVHEDGRRLAISTPDLGSMYMRPMDHGSRYRDRVIPTAYNPISTPTVNQTTSTVSRNTKSSATPDR